VRRGGRVPLLVALVLGDLAAAPLLHAADRPEDLPPVVVTATRIPTPLADLPASVTVITRAEIEARQPASALELLRQVPGLHVERAGGRGSVTSLFTRGADPNYTVVLVDGVKMNDPTNSRGGSFDLSSIDVGLIERIEVLRGPFSAVYGSDALGGVVNIVTREAPPHPSGAVEAGGGRYGWHRVATSGGGRLSRADLAVSAVYEDEGEPVRGNAFRDAAVHARGGVALGARSHLGLVTRYAGTHAASFPDDSGGPDLAVRRAVDRRDADEVTIGLTPSVAVRPWLDVEAQATFYRRTERFASPGVAPGVRDPFGIPPNRDETRFRRETVTASVVAQPRDTVRAAGGVDVQLEQGRSAGTLRVQGAPLPTRFALERETWAPFAELRVTPLRSLVVHAGARVDVPSAFAAEVSPRLGAQYTFDSSGTTLRGSWGRGFKLPSFFALGNPIVGNPRLVPETGWSGELGASQPLWGGRLVAAVTPFWSRYEHAVDFDEGPPPRLVNRAGVRAAGVELTADAEPAPALGIGAHATYTATDIEGTVEELRSRPEWTGGIAARWTVRTGLSVGVDLAYVGTVLDSSIPTGDRVLDDYVELDAAVRWAVADGVSIWLAVTNLLDTERERAIGFPAPGVWPQAGMRFTF
jgi:vitamin B12 transporter